MSSNPVLRNFLITAGVLAVLGGTAYLYFHRTGSVQPSLTASTTSQAGNGVTVSGLPPGATVSEETQSSTQAPDYKKAIVFSPSLDATAQAAIRMQFEQVKSILAKDSTNFDAWIRLGTIRKIAGDYAGAAEIWEYTSKIYPTSSVSYNNLGDLYMNFIKDYPKAEVNFKQAIVLNPHGIDYYRSLFYLYRDIYKDSAKAEAIRAEGLKNNPGNADLQKL